MKEQERKKGILKSRVLSGDQPSGKLKNTLGIIIALFAFALYAQSISFGYVLDDTDVIKENTLVKQGFSAIPTLLKTDRLSGLNDPDRFAEYRPIPMIIFAMEWQLFPANPGIYHLFNVILYSLSCWLVFMLLYKLVEKKDIILPFVCSVIYAAHPIHTEVVDNIKSLDEILCFLFALASAIFFIKFIEKKTFLNFLFASLSYFISLLSKETGVTFLVIIPLMLFTFTKAKPKEIYLIAMALVAASSIFLLIRYHVLASIPSGNVNTGDTPYNNFLVAAPDIISQKATAFYVLLKYLFILAFPYHLSYDYSFSQIPIQQISSPGALLGILIYLCISIYAILKIRSKDKIAFGILFYLVTLSPVSNLFLLIHWPMADRFLFMPSLGFCMVLSILLIKLSRTEISKAKVINLKQLITTNSKVFVVLLIITGLYSFRTVARNSDWKDNLSLFSHDVKVVPNSAKAHFNYGLVLLRNVYPLERGKDGQNNILYSAISEFNKSKSIYGNFNSTYYRLGVAYLNLGDYTNAITNYETGIQLRPRKSPSYVYCDLGFAYTKAGQYEKAISILDTALKYYPDYVDAYIKKSYAYLSVGKNSEAISESDKVLKLDSNNMNAYINKGYGYYYLKQYIDAREVLSRALRIDSTNETGYHILGMICQDLGDTLNAEKYFHKMNH